MRVERHREGEKIERLVKPQVDQQVHGRGEYEAGYVRLPSVNPKWPKN